MVQNWENFMSPSGGYTSSRLTDDPMMYLGADLAFGLAPSMLFEPMKRESTSLIRNNIRELYGMKKAQPSTAEWKAGAAGKPTNPRRHKQRLAPYDSTVSKKLLSAKKQLLSERLKYNKLSKMSYAAGWVMLGTFVANTAAQLLTPGVSREAYENDAKGMGMTTFLDSSQAYTQRQRALMAIHDSQLGIRNVIGSEAGMLHR